MYTYVYIHIYIFIYIYTYLPTYIFTHRSIDCPPFLNSYYYTLFSVDYPLSISESLWWFTPMALPPRRRAGCPWHAQDPYLGAPFSIRMHSGKLRNTYGTCRELQATRNVGWTVCCSVLQCVAVCCSDKHTHTHTHKSRFPTDANDYIGKPQLLLVLALENLGKFGLFCRWRYQSHKKDMISLYETQRRLVWNHVSLWNRVIWFHRHYDSHDFIDIDDERWGAGVETHFQES